MTLFLGLFGFYLGVVLGPVVRWLAHAAYRPLRCRWGWCPCRTVSTEHGISGQCVDCGRIVGFVGNETLRRYADQELKRHRHDADK